jgi:hypothetical protein
MVDQSDRSAVVGLVADLVRSLFAMGLSTGAIAAFPAWHALRPSYLSEIAEEARARRLEPLAQITTLLTR